MKSKCFTFPVASISFRLRAVAAISMSSTPGRRDHANCSIKDTDKALIAGVSGRTSVNHSSTNSARSIISPRSRHPRRISRWETTAISRSPGSTARANRRASGCFRSIQITTSESKINATSTGVCGFFLPRRWGLSCLLGPPTFRWRGIPASPSRGSSPQGKGFAPQAYPST